MRYWTKTWAVAAGCKPISSGCANCYASGVAHNRISVPKKCAACKGTGIESPGEGCEVCNGSGKARPNKLYAGLTDDKGRWNGQVRLNPEGLAAPLRVRKTWTWFASMCDPFHEDAPFEYIAAMIGVALACPSQRFLLLTKRAERIPEWWRWMLECNDGETAPAPWFCEAALAHQAQRGDLYDYGPPPPGADEWDGSNG